METKKANQGIIYGLIAGLVAIMFGLILYLSGAKWMVHPIAYFGMLIPITFAVMAGIKQKRLNDGYLSFPEALKVVFTTFVIATLISTAFNYVLLNLIDVPFREALTQEVAQKTQEFMQKFGAPQDKIDKAVEEMLKGNQYSLSKQALGIATSCIFWFIISLIIAAIIKKKKPEFPGAVA